MHNNLAKIFASTYLSPKVTLRLCISLLKDSCVIQSECQSNTVPSCTVQSSYSHEPQFVSLLVFNTNSFEFVPSSQCVLQHTVQSSYSHEAQFIYSSRLHQQFESSISNLSSKDEVIIPHTTRPTWSRIRQSHPRCKYCMAHNRCMSVCERKLLSKDRQVPGVAEPHVSLHTSCINESGYRRQ
jgi:hypothetical protein